MQTGSQEFWAYICIFKLGLHMHCCLVMIGLLYKAQPYGCQHRFTQSAEAKAPPHEGFVLHVHLAGHLLCTDVVRAG